MASSYTPEQQRVINALVSIGRKRGVGRRRIIAALETGAVESNFRNLPGGDADSQGWRQERASLYKDPTNLRASINRFYDETMKVNGTAGQIAAQVQRPAAQYRGRYGQNHDLAVSLLQGGGGAGAGWAVKPSTESWQEPTFNQAGFEDAKKKYVLQSMIGKSNPNSFLIRSGLLGDPQSGEPSPLSFVGSRKASVQLPGVPNTGGAGGGQVSVAPGANRPGVGLKPVVKSFVGEVAGIYGKPLTITTGTNHNQMTTTGNVSDHWDGRGADVTASGAALTRMGQAALVAAGMDPKKARQQKGGAYTLYKGGQRIQVIFNSNVGGNHFNHLHVGIGA